MNQHTESPQEAQSTGAGAPRSVDFETAQRDLLAAFGLDARSRFVELQRPRVRTHVLDVGPRDGEPPLVLVHGGSAFGAFFSPLVARLDGTRMLAVDRPGYGLSGDFTYTERNLRRTAVDVLEGVVDELGVDRVDLLGHSMGGYASVQFALARPDRVRRLILVDAAAFPGTYPPLPLRLMTVPGIDRLIRWLQQPGEEGALDLAEIFGERETVQAYPALVRAIAAHERDPGAAATGLSELSAFLSIRGWHSSVRLSEAELGEIQQPTLVVWGEDDPIGGTDDVRAGVAAIPNVRLESLPTAHVPFFGHPGRCAELVREVRAGEPSSGR